MVLFVILVIVGVIIALLIGAVYGSTDDSTNKESYNSQPSKEQNDLPSTHQWEDTLEQQTLNQCIARFCGAINTVREASSYKDEDVAWFIVGFKEGKTDIVGGYFHDTDHSALSALQGRYTQYYGFKRNEDGFKYDVDGIKDGLTPNDKLIPSAEALARQLKYYLNDPIIDVKCITGKDEHSYSVDFHFANVE